MTHHLTAFWHWYVAIITVVSMVACGVLLWSQTTRKLPIGSAPELHGNVWDDDLTEYNHPLPNWWRWLFYLTLFFGALYLFIFPGLGGFAGLAGWSSAGQYEAEVKQADVDFGPIFAKHSAIDIPTLAKDAQANAAGQRLFLNYCAQCHGSDAAGGKGFPNLRDKDWLYGGDPATIEASITSGRNGVMPALGEAIGGAAGTNEMSHYVRSLAGLKHNASMAAAAAPKFAICAACHGADGKGNRQLGAPNLTDDIWLYGSAVEDISATIKNGRGVNQLVVGQSAMPAQGEKLGPAKIHLLAAYVYSLGGGEPPVGEGASEPAAAAAVVAPAVAPAAAPADVLAPVSATPPTQK
ncbi:MAG TPA: cytochrome-c oxidase, cbb3-type subunit III [Betaproteobacteria bacterium]|nr:cytochrome-c oxidase, cbb3-type subunit III [Betaproteobacteria bacterium]